LQDISSDDLDFYDIHGYLLVKNIIPENEIDKVREFIAFVIKIEAERLGIKDDYTVEQLLHFVLIDVKKKNRESSSWIY